MAITTLIPSMFHRRLLLLAGASSLAIVPLSLRLGDLSIRRSEALRAAAEERLVRVRQTPTIRGAITDRKGRVLAQDRPSYDVAVLYSVITGDWARQRAGRAARRSVGAAWLELSPAERESLVLGFAHAYGRHLERGWDALAVAAGVSRAEIDQNRAAVVAEVTRRRDRYAERLVAKEMEAIRAQGREPTIAEVEDARTRAAKATISEQESTHALLRAVSDEAGFACQALEGDEVPLVVGPEDLGDDLFGSFSPAQDELVERLPGLRVLDAGEREYPFESAMVPLDRSTFPGPLKHAPGEAPEPIVNEDGSETVPPPPPLMIRVDGLAMHVLGRLRDKVHAEDQAARLASLNADPALRAAAFEGAGIDRGSYREFDRVGDMGVEASQEPVLRGLRGVQVIRMDSGKRSVIPARAGRDVRLTIDALLQARVQAVMSPEAGLAIVQPWHGQEGPTQKPGEALNGAAVVLDIDSGDILAMASMPSFTHQQVRDEPETVFSDPTRLAYLNRAISKPYQPGSIVKPLILVGAVQRGNFSLDQRIECTGHLFENRPSEFRCWIYKRFSTTHTAQFGHDLSAEEAIMASCNIFFFTLGRRLGLEGVTDIYREFGVGETFNLGLRDARGENIEYPGVIGSADGTALGLGDAIQMGIGQGPVAWSPLHAADAYATLARPGGVRIPPRLIMGASGPTNPPRADPRELGLSQASQAAALEGLRLASGDERGTGNNISFDGVREKIFNAPNVTVWGKTGTATSSPVYNDPDGPDGPRKPELIAEGDHSWFVVLVGRTRPQFAISVVIDFGGSGGKVSGPIANQIIHALIAEGYL
jgi:cell division protein FtsI/penicillin-binding protein 2